MEVETPFNSQPGYGLTSAAGVLGFLYDTETELKVFALETLNEEIDTVWTEVAGEVAQMFVSPSPFCLDNRHSGTDLLQRVAL